ncbi:unnamed protein product [Dovyalis caffra]|uniref:Helicase and polymerase-containing protein TEBICHI n=1 Tax=Dovyalis caffra TaxID=77055 RepID=A0AAV1SMX1_9ROSI|nr:unnamed protein product [Dovyalis caffra]
MTENPIKFPKNYYRTILALKSQDGAHVQKHSARIQRALGALALPNLKFQTSHDVGFANYLRNLPPPSPMASDSLGTRIDQFFASRKRKSSSPNLKLGIIEKDARSKAEGSPSAKGTLDNYLVNSQDENCVRGLLVKRNLALGINEVSKDEKEESLSGRLCPESCEVREVVRKEVSQGSSNAGNVGNVAVERGAKDCLDVGNDVENLELKQFTTDFLSLELQSTATSPSKPKLNDHKRHGSPFLVDCDDKTSKKRLCMSNQFNSEVETPCPIGKKPEDEQSAFLVKNGAFVFNSFGEVAAGNNPVQLPASLRKCNKIANSTVNMTECCTPSSSICRARGSEGPKSTRGSSIFSPGDAFWNEAIQVADSLFSEADNPLIPAAENIINGKCGNLSRALLKEASSRGRSLELIRKHMEKVSPLPVKQLDFLFEDKNLDFSTPPCVKDNSNVDRSSENSECGSVNIKYVRSGNIVTYHIKDEPKEEMHEVEERTTVDTVTAEKVGFPNHDADNIVSHLPIAEIRNVSDNNKFVEAGTPSSFVPLKNQFDLSNWLPPEVCSIYKRKGISKLYSWQVDCLQVDGVLQRRNLVYCASTSAGKSFVAEILMLRRVISTGKIALLVLPYVSICAEKAEHLEGLLEPLGKHVRSYYGNQGGGTLPKDTSVAVCTIEKANSLINRLLEEGRLSEVGIMVIDELHMVGDQSRGYLLELLLTKLRYAAGEGNSESSSGESSGTSSKGDPAHGVQIVGMSATMPNVAAVADWLQAALYQTNFRPVPLEEYIKVGDTIYDKKMDLVRTISRAADLGGKDPDHIVELCNEVVQEGHSVLIFCSSRKGCESTARHISKYLKKFSVNVQNDSEFADITSAIDALRRCPAGLDSTLDDTLPCGVAYHHAGLTVEEREIIETCYRKGLLRILTATSTLAAGVNLPARRVIFRQPRIGRDFIDGTRYRQMAGRAGRTGIDTKGESVLICKPEELKRIMGLLNESCPPLQSCLSEDKNGMTHAILEVVAGGIVQTANDIHRYVRCTLLNSTKPFRDVVKSAQDSLRWLCHRKFLEWNEDTKLYSTTPLGRAAFGSSLCPEESLIVLDDLSRAREAFVLASDLHLVYLVTPTNVDVEPNWELYYERFMELSALDQSVGNRVGVSEPFLMRMAHGAPMRGLNRSIDNTKGLRASKYQDQSGVTNKSVISDEQTLRVCKRFYVALILSRLVQEEPVPEVCEAFKVARGMVQSLQENAGRFASMVSVFCERLGWHDLEGLVAKFQNRVSFGVRAEIVELTNIPYVKGSRARALYKAGLRTPQAIAEASIPEIGKALFESSSWTRQVDEMAAEGSAQRRMQLGIAKKIKNSARKIVLDKAEEARLIAFAAFKSLGFKVPQFSPPLLSNASENLVEQGTAGTLFGDDSNIVLHVDQRDHASSMLFIEEGRKNSGKVTLANGVDKLTNTFSVGLETAAEGNSNSQIQCNNGTEDSTVPAKESSSLGTKVGSTGDHKNNSTGDHKNNADTILSVQLGQNGDGTGTSDRVIETRVQEQCSRENLSSDNKDRACERGPINASDISGGFDSFLDLWDAAREYYFDIHYNKRSDVRSVTPFEIHGIAICWENSRVYYINLPKDLLWSHKQRNDSSPPTAFGDKNSTQPPENWLEIFQQRWNKIGEIMGKEGVPKFTWNLKVQLQVLKGAVVSIQRFGPSRKISIPELIDSSHLMLSPVNIKEAIDMCIVAWILWPDEEKSSNPNLEKEVKRRLSSEAVAAANRNGRWKNQMRRVAHNGCCRRVAQTRALCSGLWKLLTSEGLVEALKNIEIPLRWDVKTVPFDRDSVASSSEIDHVVRELVNVLADMELWGMGVDMEGCLQARTVLGKKLRDLEKKAYKLAGMTFSLYTTADIANVLYRHLKLPIPEGYSKGKKHPSTDKHCLDLLRHDHPIVPVIREHRTLAKLLNSTLGSICSLARLSIRTQKYTLHGHWLQTSTATGRLSMEEPNLQCVEHAVEFEMSTDKKGDDVEPERYKINARDFFIPTQDNWLLLTADYSQIELRLMAHFSKDSTLIELLSNPHGDVFSMIAARWTEKPEDSVSSVERDQTKRLVYGILYGMGANTLAEQLVCSPDEAAEKIKSFKSSFPGVASWLHGAGSAADIIKIAMINIHTLIVGGVDRPESRSLHANKFHMLKGRCRILLQQGLHLNLNFEFQYHLRKLIRILVATIQVHDELVLEVDPSLINEAALLLQWSMENAASLLELPALIFMLSYMFPKEMENFMSAACNKKSGPDNIWKVERRNHRVWLLILQVLGNLELIAIPSSINVTCPAIAKVLVNVGKKKFGCCLHPNDIMFGVTKGIRSLTRFIKWVTKSTILIDMVIAQVVGLAIRYDPLSNPIALWSLSVGLAHFLGVITKCHVLFTGVYHVNANISVTQLLSS